MKKKMSKEVVSQKRCPNMRRDTDLTLNKDERKKITEKIQGDMDKLEDYLNEILMDTLESIDGFKDHKKFSDMIVYARRIFFRG